jgi:hypothetical protein
VRLKPLGHLSEGPSLGGVGGVLQAAARLLGQNSNKYLMDLANPDLHTTAGRLFADHLNRRMAAGDD